MDMNEGQNRYRLWTALIVLSHFIISVIHGRTHSDARIPLSGLATAFVLVVILAGPLIGLGLTWLNRQIGDGVIAAALAGSLVFGLLNHFVFDSADHVAHVDLQWRPVFTLTAILLAITEALGATLAATSLLRRRA
jgi:hypothetical protein